MSTFRVLIIPDSISTVPYFEDISQDTMLKIKFEKNFGPNSLDNDVINGDSLWVLYSSSVNEQSELPVNIHCSWAGIKIYGGAILAIEDFSGNMVGIPLDMTVEQAMAGLGEATISY